MAGAIGLLLRNVIFSLRYYCMEMLNFLMWEIEFINTRYIHRIRICILLQSLLCCYHHNWICLVMLFRKEFPINLSNCLEQRARSRLILLAISVPKKVRRAISNSSRCPCSFVDPSFPFRVNSRLLYSAALNSAFSLFLGVIARRDS